MQLRTAKTALMAAMTLFFTLVVFNNVTDFDSNYEFVRHVLKMDTTFPGNHGMWRAIDAAWVHKLFYLGIIAYEALNAVLCGRATWRMARAVRDGGAFVAAREQAAVALAAGMLLWLAAFLTVGAEWFLMWQSATWNGQQAAERMFLVEGVLMVVMLVPEEIVIGRG